MGNSYPPPNRHYPPNQKRTKTINKIFDVDESGDRAKSLLQQVLTSLPKKKKKTSLKLNAFTIEKRAITLISIL